MPTEEGRSTETRRFGKYTLIDRIAARDLAEVFLARQAGHEGLEKTLVVKRIRPHLSRQASFVERFLSQAKLAAQLNHPNIAQIYDLGKVGDTYFVAAEYIFGRDMRRITPKADAMGIAFPMVYALKIASSVCEGLFYAHQMTDIYGHPLNIVHQEVTPENIFVSFDGTVKIDDFGIAGAAGPIEQKRTPTREDKLGFMSPEQRLGKPLDHRSDIFSLGAVLYEWVTGFKHFTSEAGAGNVTSITESKIRSLRQFKTDIPEAVVRILLKAVAKDPQQRYQTAWEMQHDIDQFLSQYEFTPSKIHLSSFLKQLFSDDLDEEKKRLATGIRGPQVHEPWDEAHDTDGGPEAAPIPLRPKPADVPAADVPATDSEKVLTIGVDGETYQALKGLAERNRVAVGTLVRDVLANYVKYK